MRRGGGKAKGANFERDICKRLSLWVTNGKHEDVFWRSAMSGGRSTVAHAKGKRLSAQAGDISCIHPAGDEFSSRFFCECKFYADLNFEGLITGKGKLIEFWKVAVIEATKYEKLPFLIAKQNRQETILCLDSTGRSLFNVIKLPIATAPPHDLQVYLFENFLDVVPARW